MSKLLSEFSGGGLIYAPGLMAYDGSTGYYTDTTVTTSGNKLTYVMRFSRAPYSIANKSEFLARTVGTYDRGAVSIYSDDYTDDADRENTIRFRVQNSSGTVICQLFSIGNFCDNALHTLVAAFDADAGTAVFVIDGVDVDDTGNADRIAPTTGTLVTGTVTVKLSDPVLSTYFAGSLGFFGYHDLYRPTWSDFMTSTGYPKELDESGWTEWSTQPRLWNPNGFMEDNRGSSGNMTKTGTIVVSDLGSTNHPRLGLATVGDAIATDIALDKIAWVDGVEIIGTGASTILKDLVSWWKLEEASGTRFDAHGLNDLTDISTVTQATGKIGNAAQFTRANSEYLKITDAAASGLDFEDEDFTLACWVYHDTLGATGYGIMTKDTAAAGGRQWSLQHHDSQVFRFLVSSDGTTNTNIDADTLGTPSTGTWYFIVAWHNSGDNTLNIQVNNGGIDSISHSGGAFNSTTDVILGGFSPISQLDGRLDEAAIWGRLLTSEERTTLYNLGAGRSYASLEGI